MRDRPSAERAYAIQNPYQYTVYSHIQKINLVSVRFGARRISQRTFMMNIHFNGSPIWWEPNKKCWLHWERPSSKICVVKLCNNWIWLLPNKLWFLFTFFIVHFSIYPSKKLQAISHNKNHSLKPRTQNWCSWSNSSKTFNLSNNHGADDSWIRDDDRDKNQRKNYR